MKSLVLGLILASVSMSFAQNNGASAHQQKKRFIAKKRMVVQPLVKDVLKNASADDSDQIARSTEGVDSRVVRGVVRLERGTPYIIVGKDREERKMMPLNLSKKMAIEGQEIEFSYKVSEVRKMDKLKEVAVVSLYDVSISPRK